MKNKMLWLLVIALSALFLWGVIYVSNAYLSQKSGSHKHSSEKKNCRTSSGEAYVVAIYNNRVTPLTTIAKLCDTITIINKDPTTRLIAFGVHDKHESYDGIEEKLLKKDKSFTFTLDQTGKFLFHDHDDDSVRGTFLVQ